MRGSEKILWLAEHWAAPLFQCRPLEELDVLAHCVRVGFRAFLSRATRAGKFSAVETGAPRMLIQGRFSREGSKQIGSRFRHLVGKFFSRTLSHCFNCITAQAVPGIARDRLFEVSNIVTNRQLFRRGGKPGR